MNMTSSLLEFLLKRLSLQRSSHSLCPWLVKCALGSENKRLKRVLFSHRVILMICGWREAGSGGEGVIHLPVTVKSVDVLSAW
jgi:hypothetical protein